MQRQWDLEDRDEARAYSRDVYKHLVEDAEAAGFNPLTALRNGGGANYNAAAGFAPLSRKAPVKQAVGGSPIGDAISGFGDFLSNFDPFADQKREQEYRLVESQISALNAGALSGAPRGGGSYATGGFEPRPNRQAAVLSKTGTGAGPGGQILNIWTDWRDAKGNIVQLPNPDLPETEQFMVPPIGGAISAAVNPNQPNMSVWQKPAAGFGKLYSEWEKPIRSRPLTEKEKAEYQESWLPSWVPRLSW